MRASNKSSDAHKTSAYEPLRLVSEKSSHQAEDIFAGQTSPQAQRMRADIERVARRPFNILITGETGTGKTQMARQIHRMSARANKPFIELNCANLPDQLVEAELFGHRKGAFTSADYDRKGLFEEADGGILFLDEIGDVPLTVQNRLLKAIDEKQIKRLGTNHYHACDIQIIAATSRDLPSMISRGDFREDLYCRLAILTVHACPLRERRSDIPAIVNRLLREAAGNVARTSDRHHSYRIEEDALGLLCVFDHPGNIRALRNLVYEITSYLEHDEPVSISLVQSVLAKFSRKRFDFGRIAGNGSPCALTDDVRSSSNNQQRDPGELRGFLEIIAREGDIILPLELCILRKGESFKQWTARAKRCSIEAAAMGTGGMQSASKRLGLTRDSLKGHLKRARRVQCERLFD